MPAKKSNQPNRTKDLILFFAVPLAVVAIAMLIVYIPRLLASPQYDFIYSVCARYECDTDYKVDSLGNITQETDNSGYRSDGVASLRYYDTKNNSFKNLGSSEANQYRLNTSSKSPDGYTLSRDSSGGGGFLFWGSSSDSGWYLKNGMLKQQVDFSLAGYDYYSDNINFLGWVEK